MEWFEICVDGWMTKDGVIWDLCKQMDDKDGVLQGLCSWMDDGMDALRSLQKDGYWKWSTLRSLQINEW